MIGRGILRNIQAFKESPSELTPQQRVQLFLDHLDLYEQTWGEEKPFDPMKKFAKLYISEFAGAADVRAKVMETKSGAEAREVLSACFLLPTALK